MSTLNGLPAHPENNAGRITRAIASASQQTGVNFAYLMGQAQIESSMDPHAQARTSSATGLYQFIDQSWLAIMDNHGAKHGMDWAADAIGRSRSGRYHVADPALRQQILDLRNNPETASVMAAEHASDNRAYLEGRTGRAAEPVDLYLAHFLGPSGAAKFLTNMSENPGISGASLFPAAARANRNIFYGEQGRPRGLDEIRDRFASKLANGAQIAGANRPAGADQRPVGPPPALEFPDDAPTVMPADYVRIEHERLAQQHGSRTPYPDLAPRAETARLAYLMLATFGR